MMIRSFVGRFALKPSSLRHSSQSAEHSRSASVNNDCASIRSFRKYFREKASNVLRACGMQCNYVAALKTKRACQLTELYTRLYGPAALKFLMNSVRQKVWSETKTKVSKRNALIDSLFAVTLFSWEKSRIEWEELERAMVGLSETAPPSPAGCQESLNRSSNAFTSRQESRDNIKAPAQARWPVNDPWPQLGRESREDFLKQIKGDGSFESVIDREHIKVWRQPVPGTYLFQYKIHGSYKDISAKSFYYVQADLDHRKSWDSKVVKLEVVDTDDVSGSEVVHWIHKYPYPMRSREYVYVRRYEVDPVSNRLMLVGRSVDHPSCPHTSQYVRVNEYLSKMVIKPHTTMDEPGFDYVMSYFDDPQSALPSGVSNWLSNYGVPAFVQTVHGKAKELEATGRDLTEGNNYYVPNAQHQISPPSSK